MSGSLGTFGRFRAIRVVLGGYVGLSGGLVRLGILSGLGGGDRDFWVGKSETIAVGNLYQKWWCLLIILLKLILLT